MAIWKSSEATEGGLRGVVDVQGEIEDIHTEEGKYGEQCLIVFKDPEFLAMESEEDDLPDNRDQFTVYVNTSNKKGSKFTMLLESAEQLGIEMPDGPVNDGSVYRMQRVEHTWPGEDQDGNQIKGNVWQFVKPTNGEELTVDEEYIREQLLGKTVDMARRAALTDPELKKVKGLREQIKSGEIDDYGLAVDENKNIVEA